MLDEVVVGNPSTRTMLLSALTSRIGLIRSSSGDPSQASAFRGLTDRQYPDLSENPRGYCPNHATGVKLPDDIKVTPLQYVD